MPYYFFLILLFCFSSGFASRDSLFFNEFAVSANVSGITERDTKEMPGFGLGVYHSFRKDEFLGFTYGFEFNLTRHYFLSVYESHFSSLKDAKYTICSLSVPLLWRLNYSAKKLKYYFEGGFFLDVSVFTYRKAMAHRCTVVNNILVCSEDKLSEKLGPGGFNLGPSVGIGTSIPFYTNELLLRLDCKLGLIPWGAKEVDLLNRYLRLTVGIRI
jgi:hypothetical protein